MTELSGKRLRLLELVLVVWIAFSSSLLTSFYSGLLHPGGAFRDLSTASTARMAAGILSQIGSLALLVYVLFRQGRRLADLGLVLFWKALPISVALFLAGSLASYGWQWLLFYGYRFAMESRLPLHAANVGFLYGADRGWSLPLLLVYTLLNPIKEELIARAYVLSEVRFLTGRTWAAVAASVVLQVSYHFYQGVWPAIGHAALFLVFALYYARTGRIVPVILAHLYFDLLALRG